MKMKKCAVRGCNGTFKQFNSLIKACSPACALILAKRDRKAKEKKERAADKKQRDTLRPYSYWVKKAQASFNAYIRGRDKDLPCISCQKHHTGQYHCGHFLTTAARPDLRFNSYNCNKQCAPCNNHLSGNIINYRINLVKKIGRIRVEHLENYNEKPVKYNVAQLKNIAKIFRKKARMVKKRRE